MRIQSLSVCVPGSCPNNCRYCVAKIHKDDYSNMLNEKLPFYDLYYNDYIKRLEFARDNDCNVVVLTGDGEPLANKNFLKLFGLMNRSLSSSFRWVELQTSGVYLDDKYLRFLRNHVGVSTISLSLSSLSNEVNNSYNQIPESLQFDIKHLCSEIKRYDFNLRLSLNLTDWFEYHHTKTIIGHLYGRGCDELFRDLRKLGADQVTFRKLYKSTSKNTEQDRWIEEHSLDIKYIDQLKSYIKDTGKPLEILPFGATRYGVAGISTVLDDDCMVKDAKDTLRYLILRPNCKLYSRWDLRDSLVF